VRLFGPHGTFTQIKTNATKEDFMNLDMEVLDNVETPISTWGGIALAAGAFVVGVGVGVGLALLIT
jgi:hypothetical protein